MAAPAEKRSPPEVTSPPAKKPCASAGPVVWWARNDLRVEDNPVLRAAVGEAAVDGAPLAAVFVFDPRFLDRSNYGRVTDPDFKKSISTRKKITFSSRKTNALRARFWLQCVRALGEQLIARGSKLFICHGKPEDVFEALPSGSRVFCQSEPVSIEQTDVEDFTEAVLQKKNSVLTRDCGAMSLYRQDDLPFAPKERPDCYTGLGKALGWEDIWTTTARHDWAAPVRPPVAAPKMFPAAPSDLDVAGLIPLDTLEDEAKTLRLLGYTEEEIKEAQAQTIPQGGEPAARALLDEWVEEQGKPAKTEAKAVYWDLPCAGQSGPGAEHDPMQWVNLSQAHGWMRISHYMAVGCVTAREIFARAAATRNFAGAAHRLMWREFHRLTAMKYHRHIAWLQGPGKVERPWSQDPEIAEAWKKGRSGLPYIDACMRELNQTGWLAYKGRKTAGHFLVFDLGIDWRIGAFHYEEVLMDYDFAMNYGNWIVVAKVDKPGRWGAYEVDADHVDLKHKLRAEQMNDPTGAYIRRWVPELRNVKNQYIHTPWLMPEGEMEACGCVVGRDYPVSLVGPLALEDCAGWECGTVEENTASGLLRSVEDLKAQLAAKEKELAALRK